MKLQLLRRVVTVAFILLSLGSTAYVFAATINYLRFYPGLSQLQQQITKIAYGQDKVSNETTLLAHIVIRNPTDYSGFAIGGLELRMYFVHPMPPANPSLFANLPLIGSQVVNKPIGPRSEVISDIVVQLTSAEVSSLISFNATYSGQIITRAVLTVDVITFLNPVTGHVRLSSEESISLS
jgi:hypothetical protein